MARSQFLYTGKRIRYGSIQEQIAIHAFNREREAQLFQPIFSVVDPDKFDKLLRQYRGVLYPEYRYDEMRYMKQAQEMFRKLRKVNIRITPK